MNDIDVGGSRVYRIDVSAFWGLASERDRCFLDFVGLCGQVGCMDARKGVKPIMKVRDSGMPEESYWESLLDVPLILERIGIQKDIKELVEFGCGYGTFTIPAAKVISGRVVAFEINDQMIEITNSKKNAAHLSNITVKNRDFIADGTGLKGDTADFVMAFNILHHDKPAEILNEAFRVLKHGGRAGLMHWNYDPTTPRGPSLDIRPKPEDMQRWALDAGFRLSENRIIDLPPYHYGLIAYKP